MGNFLMHMLKGDTFISIYKICELKIGSHMYYNRVMFILKTKI
jgi:hypothetical protein